ncbi:carbonic anhydrase, partial [Nocardia wallacei]|uniref:carbonic anhydrase n=3 Tax=Nocardia TaxID=1817 RepID=UPI002456739E
LPKLTKELAKVPTGTDVLVELTVDFLDHASYEAIHDWARQHENTGGTVQFAEIGTARMAHVLNGPPQRGRARGLLDGALGPWRERTGNVINTGVAAYHRGNAHVVRPHLDGMRDRQDNPHSLFLTCADSRIVPNVITNSGPGDLFTVRNVGALIPADGSDTSFEAALAFAVENLHVRNIVVCGHSSCGAMRAVLDGTPTAPGLEEWLAHALPSLARFRAAPPVAVAAAAAGYDEVAQLSMVNVAVQLQTLRAHPIVSRAMAEHGLTVSGLFFDIGTARVIEITTDTIGEIVDTDHRSDQSTS